jgi:hypothetical protein
MQDSKYAHVFYIGKKWGHFGHPEADKMGIDPQKDKAMTRETLFWIRQFIWKWYTNATPSVLVETPLPAPRSWPSLPGAGF